MPNCIKLRINAGDKSTGNTQDNAIANTYGNKFIIPLDFEMLDTQALYGLAPKCKLINMHELINKSTNDYVTLLPCENGANVNNKR